MNSNPVSVLASIPRKTELKRRYLPKHQSITPLQKGWASCFLDAWGAKYGGEEGPSSGKVNVIGRLMIRKHWNERESAKIIDVVETLHGLGYSGNELFLKAWQMINPQNSVSNLLARANEQEDADLVEDVINEMFKPDNPIRHVAIKHYCDRKCSQEIAEDLARITGIHVENARTRVRWCKDLLLASVYCAIKRKIEDKITDIAA